MSSSQLYISPSIHQGRPSTRSFKHSYHTVFHYIFPLFPFLLFFFGSFFLHCCCSQGGGRGVQALRQHQHHNHNITVEFITRPTLGESFNCLSCCPEALNTWSIPPPSTPSSKCISRLRIIQFSPQLAILFQMTL